MSVRERFEIAVEEGGSVVARQNITGIGTDAVKTSRGVRDMNAAIEASVKAMERQARAAETARAQLTSMQTGSLEAVERLARSSSDSAEAIERMRAEMAKPLNKMTTWDTFNQQMTEGERHFDNIVRDLQDVNVATGRTAGATENLGKQMGVAGATGDEWLKKLMRGQLDLNAATVSTGIAFASMASVGMRALGALQDKAEEGIKLLWDTYKPGGLLDRLDKGQEITFNEDTDAKVKQIAELKMRIQKAEGGRSVGSEIWAGLKGPAGDAAARKEIEMDAERVAGLRMSIGLLQEDLRRVQLIGKQPIFEAALQAVEHIDEGAAAALRLNLAQIKVYTSERELHDAWMASGPSARQYAAAVAGLNAELEALRANQGIAISVTPMGGMSFADGQRVIQDLRAAGDKRYKRLIDEDRIRTSAQDAAKATGMDPTDAADIAEKAIVAARRAAAKAAAKARPKDTNEIARSFLHSIGLPDQDDIAFYAGELSIWMTNLRDGMAQAEQIEAQIRRGRAGAGAFNDARARARGQLAFDMEEERKRREREADATNAATIAAWNATFTADGGLSAGVDDMRDRFARLGTTIHDNVGGAVDDLRASIKQLVTEGKFDLDSLMGSLAGRLYDVGEAGLLSYLGKPKIPGAQYGADFRMPSGGGPDSQLLAMRFSPRERIIAIPEGQPGNDGRSGAGGGNIRVVVVNDAEADAMAQLDAADVAAERVVRVKLARGGAAMSNAIRRRQ